MKRKSKTHSTRKQCQTCQQFGWYRPRERKCKRARYPGSTLGYCCWGPLIDAPIKRVKADAAGLTVIDAPTADIRDRALRGASHRRDAERKLDAVRRRMGDTKQSIDHLLNETKREVERLRRLLARQQRDERKWTKEAVMSDEQLSARRQRAQHAARISAKVQRVRRRLSASAAMFNDDADAGKLTLRRARRRRLVRRIRRPRP